MDLPKPIEAIGDAVQQSITDNYWARKTAHTAPEGKVRVMHVDPRDHTETFHADYNSEGEARDALGTMLVAQREVMCAFNDKGEIIVL